jgi:uncharacterized protein (DUF1800 family)
MELFTMGVGHYTEPDVYAAARVFSGWNLMNPARNVTTDPTQSYKFVYNPNQHETSAKTFSFPIYKDGSSTIPARSAAEGMQDGIDFIEALAANPNTGRYLATKLYRFFISEAGDVNQDWVTQVAAVYQSSGYDMKAVMREVLMSNEFWDSRTFFARYAWPAEFVVRAIKDIGWSGYSVSDALTPLTNMGQNLYDPPDVSGWDLGQSWFSTGSMLARMNFASQLASNQRAALRELARPAKDTPESLVNFVYGQLTLPDPPSDVYNTLVDYVRAGGTWTGSETQLLAKTAGLFHLMTGSGEYQVI